MRSNPNRLIVSHAPFLHNGSSISERSYHTLLATLPAVLVGIYHYHIAALAVVCLSISSAMIWEVVINRISRRPDTLGDGTAALTGMIFAMLVPATMPWWVVVTGTFFAIVIGKHIFGGVGANPFNPVVVSVAILAVSWKEYFDFNAALVDYDTGFTMAYPLWVLKKFGVEQAAAFNVADLLLGNQSGGIGATFGIGLAAGGLYLIYRGFIRWEISLSFLAGIFITAWLFNKVDPAAYAGPFFHLFAGYTLIGAFFLATEYSSSPVNFIPMLIYGAGGGIMTILIRNIGTGVDGVIVALLLMNSINPLLDNIRPKALGKAA